MATLHTQIGTELRLVGYPRYGGVGGHASHGDTQQNFFLGTVTSSDLKSLCISIQGQWPQTNAIHLSIAGVDPATGTAFSTEPIKIPLPSQPAVDAATLLSALPKLSREARTCQDLARQEEILTVVRLLKQEFGDLQLLVENERYLSHAIQAVPATEENLLLDALNSLSV